MININMIAERRTRKMREMTILRYATIGVIVILLAMVTLNFAEWKDAQSLKVEMVQVKDDLKELEQSRHELQTILDQIDEKRPVVLLLEQVRISEGAWMTILADISRVVPSDVVIQNFSTAPSADGINLRIAGQARDEQTVGAFMLAIRQQTGWARTPSLGSVTSETSEQHGKRVRFDITVPVKDLIGGEL